MGNICMNCGADNPDGHKKCDICGASLFSEGEAGLSSDETQPPPNVDSIDDESTTGKTDDVTQAPSHLETVGSIRNGDVVDAKYRILELVGSGGMGDVYRALQTTPVERTVALKVIKPGMDTREVVARFESERQALALMEHTNIAKVFDGGATDSGLPYFVMEYVKGLPINDYCDRQNLDTAERLRLFRSVCHAVQHAHQKGVIHRDLKSSNVLVSIEENSPVPKIIDFGVAKATGYRLSQRTLFTATGQLMGTPEYMSPEQAEMSGLDVDTRTDIYSLGVMLYELLVGVLPFDPAHLRKAALAEIQRIIRETDPPRPSTRYSQLGDTRDAIARHRRTDPGSLARNLRGDLEWITLKAMEKDRTRRYASASEMAGDIERHLAHEPILAGPPSRLYRMGKYVRRHRLGVTAASLIALLLVAGVIGTAMGLVRARRAEKRAVQKAETARRVSDFLVDMFKVSDPARARGRKITAREILDKGARDIKSGLTDEPEIRAALMQTMGNVYTNLGYYEEADPLISDALQVYTMYSGPESLQTVHALIDLAWLRNRQGRYAEAEKLAIRAFRIEKAAIGENTEDTAAILSLMGVLAREQGDYAKAEKLQSQALDIHTRFYGAESREVAGSLMNLASTIKERGDLDRAKALYEQALRIYETTVRGDSPYLSSCLCCLGNTFQTLGRLDEAERYYKRSLAIDEKIYGPDHPVVATDLLDLGTLQKRKGELSQAELSLSRSIAIYTRAQGPSHPDLARALSGLAGVYFRQGRISKAASELERAVAITEKALGPDHPRVAFYLMNLAGMYFSERGVSPQKQGLKALPLLQKALKISDEAYQGTHPFIADLYGNLGLTYQRLGDYKKAIKWSESALEMHRALYGDQDRHVVSDYRTIGGIYDETGKRIRAASAYEQAVELAAQIKYYPSQHVELLEEYARFLRKTGDAKRAAAMEAKADKLRPAQKTAPVK